MPRRLLLLLAALAALALVSVSSAFAASSAQTRVRAQNEPGQARIGLATLQSPCTRPGSTAPVTRTASGFCVATEEAGINISDEALEHIEDRHLPSGANGDDASQFSPDTDVVDLIRDAEGTPAEEQANSRFARVVTSPDVVGYDAATGEYTHTYTVITEANGDLVTAFPGMP
jgi:hypothetical protein